MIVVRVRSLGFQNTFKCVFLDLSFLRSSSLDLKYWIELLKLNKNLKLYIIKI